MGKNEEEKSRYGHEGLLPYCENERASESGRIAQSIVKIAIQTKKKNSQTRTPFQSYFPTGGCPLDPFPVTVSVLANQVNPRRNGSRKGSNTKNWYCLTKCLFFNFSGRVLSVTITKHSTACPHYSWPVCICRFTDCKSSAYIFSSTTFWLRKVNCFWNF